MDKEQLINQVKQELQLLIQDCNDLTKLARQALEVFDDFKSERTLWKLQIMFDEIRVLSNTVLNMASFFQRTCLDCIENKKAKENN